MAETKQELTDFISSKLFQNEYQQLAFSDLASAVAGLTEPQKAKLMDGVLEGQELKVGVFLHELMIDVAKTRADTEAASMLVDDNLSLPELLTIF